MKTASHSLDRLLDWFRITTVLRAVGIVGIVGASVACGEPASRTDVPPPKAVLDEGVLHEILDEPDAFVRAQRLSMLAPMLGPAAIPHIQEVLEDDAVNVGPAEMELLVRAWALHDPSAAFGWSTGTPHIAVQLAALIPAIEELAKRDPKRAWEQVLPMTMLSTVNSRAMQVAFVRGWFDSGKPGLVDWIRDLGVGFERQRALRVFARRKIRRDGEEAAIRWAESLPDEPHKFKLNAFRQLGAELAVWNPEAAKAFCEAHCDGPFGDGVPHFIARRWAQREGQAAVEWVAKVVPPGRDRDRGVRDAYGRWLRKSPEEADAWASKLGLENLGPEFSSVAELHALRLTRKDVDEALAWASKVRDPERRDLVYVRVLRQWRSQDNEAALAWLETADISDEARAKASLPMDMPLVIKPDDAEYDD